jgi:hypothetical protein
MPWGYKPTSPSVHWARPQKSLFLTGHIISHIFLINQPLTWPIGQWISIYKIWLKMIVFSDVHGCSWNHVRPLILKKKSNHRKKKKLSHIWRTNVIHHWFFYPCNVLGQGLQPVDIDLPRTRLIRGTWSWRSWPAYRPGMRERHPERCHADAIVVNDGLIVA